MKHSKRNTDLTGAAVQRPKKDRCSRRRRKAARKAQQNVILNVHKLPIVCPPDKAGRSPLFRYGGLISRALVIWLAAAGFVIFIASALEFGVPNAVIFLTALAVVTLGIVFRLGGIGKLVSLVGAGGALGGLLALNPGLPLDLFHGVLSMYNAALDRLYRVGYLAYVQYKADFSSATPH
jgi:hypothetical protein